MRRPTTDDWRFVMPAPEPVRRAAQLGLKVTAALAFLAPLMTRITMGHAFFLTGRGKLENFENTVEFFASQNIPFPALNAALVSRLEYYGGILLVLGLLTRLVAAGLASTMVVALLTERAQFLESWKPTTELGPTDISSWVFLVFLTWLVLYGPGAVSLDHFLARWLGLRSEAKPPEPARKAAA
jgi:putative oxidoreductase